MDISDITFHVSPRNGGQIVEQAYASVDGWVIKRVHDRSDGSIQYYLSAMMDDDEGDYWQSEPRNKRWRTMTDQECQSYGLR